MKAITIVLLLSMIVLSGCEEEVQDNVECNVDSDCIPAQVCHPTSCIPISQKPEPTDMLCTTECRPGTLDCNQGKCACINNQCEAEIFE